MDEDESLGGIRNESQIHGVGVNIQRRRGQLHLCEVLSSKVQEGGQTGREQVS
jgi:hypothetical protein